MTLVPGWISVPQALSRVSNVNFDIWKGLGSINIPCKIPNSKDVFHMGFTSKVLPGPLTDSIPWVGFCTQAHSKVSNVNFNIGWGSINIPCNISNGKVLAHMGFKSKVLPGLFTALSLCVGFCTSSSQQCIKCQLRYRGRGAL